MQAGLGSDIPGLAGVGGGPRGPQQQLQLQAQGGVVPDCSIQGSQQALAPLHALREQLHTPGSRRGTQRLQPRSSQSEGAPPAAAHALDMHLFKPKSAIPAQ